MNDVLRRKTAAGSRYSSSRLQLALPFDDDFAGFEYGGTSRTMDCAVHTASAHQRGVRCIHDRITRFLRNVAGALYDQQAVG